MVQVLPTRDRLRSYCRSHPGATAADIARALGVSRQLITRLADEEGIELVRYTTAMQPKETRPLEGPSYTAGGRASASLLVAADLVARGFEVFLAYGPRSSCALVALESGTRRCIRVDVQTKRSAAKYERPNERSWDHRATVLPGEPITYYPALRVAP
jgi:hypothetical protein